MRILIFDPDHDGHHLAYLRLMISAISELGLRPIVCTNREAPQSPEYAAQLAHITDRFVLDASIPTARLPPLRLAAMRLGEFRAAVRRHKPERIYIPYGDGLTQLLVVDTFAGRRAIPAGVKSEALMLRGGFAYPQTGFRSAVQSRISFELLRRAPWDIMHHLDPLPFGAVMRCGGAIAARSRLMPEPVEPVPPISREDARRRLGIEADARYVGCCGLLDERKGIDLLLAAFSAARLGASDRLLLAGKASESIRQLLQGRFADLVRSGRIVLIDRYITSEEVNLAVLAMDLMCTPYPRHIGSASIIVRAAAAGRPVLCTDFGWMGYVTKQFGLGRTCQIRDAGHLAEAISSSLEESSRFVPRPAARRFAEFHTAANFAAAWTARLREDLGRPPQPQSRSWKWVLTGDRNGTSSNAGHPFSAVDNEPRRLC